MPRCCLHRPKHALNEFIRNALMEQIAHRVHEDDLWLSPTQWQVQASVSQCQVESDFIWMARHASKSFRETFRVAVITARRDLSTTRNRVPCRLCPLNS